MSKLLSNVATFLFIAFVGFSVLVCLFLPDTEIGKLIGSIISDRALVRILLYFLIFVIIMIWWLLATGKSVSLLERDWEKDPPQTPEEYAFRGHDLRDSAEFQQAIAAYDKAIELDPSLTESYEGKGMTLVDLGKSQEALTTFDQAVKLGLDNEWVAYGRASAYLQLDNIAKALMHLRKALEIDPSLINLAKEDAILAPLQDSVDFQKLIAEYETD